MMIFEFFFMCAFLGITLIVGLIGGLATHAEMSTDSSSACDDLAKSSLKNSQTIAQCKEAEKQTLNHINQAKTAIPIVDNVGKIILYVAIGLLITYLPRFFYFCKLCGYNCCGNDTSSSRQGLATGMWGLVISSFLSSLLVVVINLAILKTIDPSVVHIIIYFAVQALFAIWWLTDIKKWVQNKKEIEA